MTKTSWRRLGSKGLAVARALQVDGGAAGEGCGAIPLPSARSRGVGGAGARARAGKVA